MKRTSFTARVLATTTALLLSLTTPAAAQKPVVLVHGIASSRGTWQTAEDALRTQFRGSVEVFRFSSSWWRPLADQEGELMTALAPYSVQARRPIVAGHSMGGLISRGLIRNMPTDAILTVGTPHQGHPLIEHQGQVLLRLAEINWAYLAAMQLGECSIWEPAERYYWYCNQIRSHTTAAIFLEVGITTAILAARGLESSVNDMSPSSPVMDTLNRLVTNEKTGDKFNFVAQLDEWDEPVGPWRLFNNQHDAWDAGYLFAYAGLDMLMMSFDIAASLSFGCEYFLLKVDGAAAFAALAYFIWTVGYWWSDILGGWPHDGFIPVTQQQYPGVTGTPLIGVSHTEETTDGRVIGQLSLIVARHT